MLNDIFNYRITKEREELRTQTKKNIQFDYFYDYLACTYEFNLLCSIVSENLGNRITRDLYVVELSRLCH